MWQQVIAVLIIIFFLFRLFYQLKKQKISRNEFLMWLIFWVLALLAVIFIRVIDKLVGQLGFSGAGIDALVYAGVIILFYLVFRMRLAIIKQDKEITKIIRAISLKDKK